jgi:hypothetical protein
MGGFLPYILLVMPEHRHHRLGRVAGCSTTPAGRRSTRDDLSALDFACRLLDRQA